MAQFKDTFLLVDKVSKPLLKISQGFKKLDEQIAKSQSRMEKWQKRTEHLEKLGKKIKDLGKGMTVGLTLPIITAGGAMVKFASDYEESLNKIDVAFGNSSKKIKDWSKNSLTAMGMSKGEALDSAALYGSIATGMGISQEKAAEMAMTLTKRGADLASFMNVRGDVAQTALKAIFTGESESLKNLGVTMTEATLQSFAYSKGIKKKINKMSEIEKVMLRYDFVLNRTRLSEDDFIKTGGGAANQMRIFQSTLKDLGETFGQYILPTFTTVLQKINGMLKTFGELPEPVKKGILVFGAVLAILGPLVTLIGTVITVVKGLNIAMMFLAANPVVATILIIVAAIVALVAATKALWKNWSKIPTWVKWVMGAFMPIIGVIELIIAGIKKIQEWRTKESKKAADEVAKGSSSSGKVSNNSNIYNNNNSRTYNINANGVDLNELMKNKNSR